MPTKTKRKKGLPFSKLSDEAKEKAREWWRDCESSDPSYDLNELFKNDLEDHYGISGCKIWYSLNCCQGDGVCFDGTPDLDYWRTKDEILESKFTELEAVCALMNYEEPSIHVSLDAHESSHTTSVKFEWDNEPEQLQTYTPEGWVVVESPGYDQAVALAKGIEEYLQERVNEIAEEMEDSGYKEIDYHNTDEYVDESMEANDYRFTKEGEIL